MLRLIAGCPHRASLRYFAIEGALVGRARGATTGGEDDGAAFDEARTGLSDGVGKRGASYESDDPHEGERDCCGGSGAGGSACDSAHPATRRITHSSGPRS